MSRGRRRVDHKREEGRFAAIPHDVLRSPKFVALAPAAVKLLLDLLWQYNGENNGRLLATLKKMRERNWRGEHQLVNARRELSEAGFIMETRKGARPNRAAWWAITWFSLDWHPEMDIKPAAYVRGLWRVRGGLGCAEKGGGEVCNRLVDLNTGAPEAVGGAPETGRIAAPGAVGGRFPTASEASIGRSATAARALSVEALS